MIILNIFFMSKILQFYDYFKHIFIIIFNKIFFNDYFKHIFLLSLTII